MSKSNVNMIADLFSASTAATLAAAEKVPADRRMLQVQEGKSHPTWLLGHMAAVTGNAVMGLCLAKQPPLPADFSPLFAPEFLGGKPIESDVAAYPSWDQIVATYKQVADAVVSAIRELDDSDLAGPPKGQVPPPLKDRFGVLGQSLVFMAMHNTYHTGQLNLLAALDVKSGVTA